MTPESPFFAEALAGLKRSPLFGGLDEATLTTMLGRCRRETWAHRRQLPLEESWERFHVLLSGRVRLCRSNPDNGRMITLFLHGPGDGFCLFSLLDGQPHEVILETLDDVTLLSVPMAEARQWLVDYPDFNRTLLPYIGRQMAALANLAADLALHDTEARLARLILRHVDDSQAEQVEPRLINDLSNESLAEMIGSVRVVVNRQLQHWKQAGIVDAHRGHLKVEKLQALAERADQHLMQVRRPASVTLQ